MYELLKSLVCRLLKVEEKQPAPPAGPHDTFQVFRACPAYLAYTLFFWKLYVAVLILFIVAISVGLFVAGGLLALLAVPLVALAAFKAAVFYTTTRLNYDLRWYVITDRSLLIREGVWIHTRNHPHLRERPKRARHSGTAATSLWILERRSRHGGWWK